MGSQQQFCLRWNNHQTNMIGVFDHLLQSETLVDVTLACDGFSLKAHKVVLSACSPYFQSLFLDNPCKHPIVILKDVKFSDLRALIDFMYRGEVNVSQDQLSALLATAETLKVKGLAEVTSGMNDKEAETASNATQSSILPQDESVSRRSSPAPKRKRIRLRRRSGGGSAVSDTEDEIQEVVPQSEPVAVDLLEAKVEINENNYTSCSQASGDVQSQDQSMVGESPAESAQLDMSPIPVTAESVFPSTSVIDVNNELASNKANSIISVMPTEVRRTNPVISTIKSSGLPVSNIQPTTSSPLPSTSGTQQVMASGQGRPVAISKKSTPYVYHECEICGRSFDRQSRLAHHTKMHGNLDSLQMQKQCRLCGRLYFRTNYLIHHYKTEHNIIMTYEDLGLKLSSDFSSTPIQIDNLKTGYYLQFKGENENVNVNENINQ